MLARVHVVGFNDAVNTDKSVPLRVLAVSLVKNVHHTLVKKLLTAVCTAEPFATPAPVNEGHVNDTDGIVKLQSLQYVVSITSNLVS